MSTALARNRTYTITLAPGKLEYQLAIRGKTQTDLLRETGMSHMTLARAFRGDRINPKTWAALLTYLTKYPPIDLAEDLLGLSA